MKPFPQAKEDIPKQALDTVAGSNKERRSAMKKHQMIAGVAVILVAAAATATAATMRQGHHDKCNGGN